MRRRAANRSHCVIVGGGHGAAQYAASLRQHGWEGPVTLVSAEGVLPYHRPPLSKGYLAGNKTIKSILIRSHKFYEQNQINTILGERVVSLDRDEKTVLLDNGSKLQYDTLALAIGARPRTIDIPGGELSGVFYLRELNDVDQIRDYLGQGRKAVIVGGGYIGLETGAALRRLGTEVTVLEVSPRVLQRITAAAVSEFFVRIHEEEGVVIRTHMTVESIQGEGRVRGVRCGDGSFIPTDLVIVGIGALPETKIAEAAELLVNNGVVVDEFGRTSDRDIVAAGDCTWHYNPLYARHVRLESVQNAVDQAKVGAATLCGKRVPYSAVPWFWSDQYDVKLQIAGLSQGFDQAVVRGDIEKSRSFAVFYLQEGRLIAVDAVNRPKEFMIGKQVLAGGIFPDPAKLEDESLRIEEALEP